MNDPVAVRPYEPAADEAWAERFFMVQLGGRVQTLRGGLVDVLAGDVLVGLLDDERAGLLCYRELGGAVELTAIAAMPRNRGLGRALVGALRDRAAGRPIRVVTTNDNLDALRFYQRLGFRLVELRPGAVDTARATLKPEIPTVGSWGIPIRDELELELSAD